MKRDFALYLKDIVESIGKIEQFIGEMTFGDFVKDEKTNNAVIRKLEVIGEAVKHLPDAITKQHAAIPWKDMARTRDKIIHFYFGVDYEIIWKVIKEQLPAIKVRLQEIIEGVSEER